MGQKDQEPLVYNKMQGNYNPTYSRGSLQLQEITLKNGSN